jgi:Ca2+:H+ antiporter
MVPCDPACTLVFNILQGGHHAEIIAHKIGEPFGTLILALAVTCIEASLIISLMAASGPGISKTEDERKSLMYEKLLNGLSPEEVNHLMDYLVSLK